MKKGLKYKKSVASSSNSKGERLGWSLVSDVKNKSLKKVLSRRKNVTLNSDSEPLLVP
ncbi:hypothetical protein [Flagellimonas halotolerans]|uniref:Uncharacterized protein n=1 Tax=Flagellimonas halotolerans TaxID=3112164 RepID=A0ABU6IP80_9FLAO|nr:MULTISPECIES: hypothetical protein [unclassified Allomuricauda]MEC3965238.1 hypothetical protein [Muricauda sp. SYSU M86414]MEC4264917.1 hypothetical protein [Muricauda sp. SYSU M84420]